MGRSKLLPVLAKVAGSLAARKVSSAIAKSSRRAPIRKRQTLAARMNRQMAKRASFKVGVPAARGPGPANPSFRGNLITVPFDVTSYTIRTDGNGVGIWSNGSNAGGYAFDLLPTKTYFGNYPFGPLINLQASAYQMYRILKLEFEYCPASQSGADGDILIAYTPDPWTGGSTSPIPYQTIGTLKDKMRSSLWGQNNDGKLVCRVKALNRSWLFINEDTPNPNPEAQRQAAAGSLIIGSQVPAAEFNHNVGSLTLRGVIQFAGQGIVQASSVNGAGGPQSSLPLTAAAAAASYTQSLANTLTVATASQPLIGQSGLTSNGWVFSGPPFLFVASASVLTMPLSGVQPGSQFQITCSWTSATGIAAAATLSPNAVFGLAPPTVTNVVSLFDAGGASAQLTALITLPSSFSPSSSSISSTTANAGSYTFAIGGLTSMTAGTPNVVITQVA